MKSSKLAHFGTLAAATLLLAGTARASGLTVVEAIHYQADKDAVLVHYHLDGGYDVSDVRLGITGPVVRIVLADARLRGAKKTWPKPLDKFVKGSYAYQLTPTTLRHKVRLRSRVDIDDVTVKQFGDVVVVRIPKRAAGNSVAMVPADVPNAIGLVAKTAAAKPAVAKLEFDRTAPDTVGSDSEAWPATVSTGPGDPSFDDLPAVVTSSKPGPTKAHKQADQPAEAGHQALLRDLFSGPGPADSAAIVRDRAVYGGAADSPADTDADDSGPLASLGADIPDVNPVTWILIVAALGFLVLAVRRKGRLPRLVRSGGGRTITVLDKKAVMGKNGVALIEAAGRLVLVGTGENGLTALADLGPSDEDFHSVVARTTVAPAGPHAPATTPAPASATDSTPELAAAPVAHAAAVPAIGAVDAFRAKVAALRSA